MPSIRLRLSKEEHDLIKKFRDGLDLSLEVSNESETSDNNYEAKPFKFNAIGDDGTLLNIENYCLKYGLNASKIKSYRLISRRSIPFYDIYFNNVSETVEAIDFEEIIKKYIKPSEVLYAEKWSNVIFDRLVFTDVHLGMDVNGSGDPLYDGKWDRDEVLCRLTDMVNFVLDNQVGNIELFIDNLGDFMDGQDGKTTRKGHDLPQNMNNKEAFDLAIEFNLKLIDSLVSFYPKVTYNFLTCDNHSGNFSYYVGQAVKGILEARYSTVTVNVIKKFISHYKVGSHTFILCHGKDDEALKFGFKPKLDLPQMNKIDHYLKENGLYDGNYIEFSKGDSHQSLFDESTSNDFHYYNYPAFSPPSNWVKTNFSNSPSGFRFFNIDLDSNIKTHHPYWFKKH